MKPTCARSSICSQRRERVVTCYSQGVNQSAQGTDKVNAIINCHLATGRIGKPGMGPFSLTGQPNAMGGREVGGLANQLAAHMGFSPPEIDRVRRFWNAPNMATREGLKAVQMFEAIERGEIKALWVMATNPAVSLPRAGAVRDALSEARAVRRLRERALERHRECGRAYPAARRRLGREGRHRHQFRAAHLAPARASCRCPARRSRTGGSSARSRGAWASRRRSLTESPPIFSASMRRCRPSRTTARAISTSARSRASATSPSTRWIRSNGRAATARSRATRASSPTAASSRPTARRASSRRRRRRCASTPSDAFPFVLNTGRVRDQWHTMTRTGLSPRLGQHTPEPFVEVHPADARFVRPRRISRASRPRMATASSG